MKKLLVLVPLLALLAAVVPGALAFNFNLPANFTFAEDSSTTINLATYVSTTGTILNYTASNPDFLDINTPGTSTNISSIINWFGRESVTFTVTVNFSFRSGVSIVLVLIRPKSFIESDKSFDIFNTI